MSHFLSALGDLFKSIYELFASFFSTLFQIVATFLSAIFQFFQSILSLFIDLFRGMIDVAGGLGRFVAGNLLAIGVIAAAVFGYLQYQRQQGRPVTVGGKKMN